MLRFRCDRVANTLSVTTNRDRASPLLAGSPTEQRLTALHSRSPPQRTYGLLQTRPHGSFAAQPAALKPPGQFRAAPLPHRCRVPSVRAPGQDFHLRSQHPYSAHQRRRCAARCARPCRAVLDCRAPLRWIAGKGCAGAQPWRGAGVFLRLVAGVRAIVEPAGQRARTSWARALGTPDARRSPPLRRARWAAATALGSCERVPYARFTVQKSCSGG